MNMKLMPKAHKPFWYEYCNYCKRKHLVTLMPCPECNGRSGQYTPQPVSERVWESCGRNNACDGCVAYREHTNSY